MIRTYKQIRLRRCTKRLETKLFKIEKFITQLRIKTIIFWDSLKEMMMALTNQNTRDLKNSINVITEMTSADRTDVGHIVAEIAIVETDPIEVVMTEEEGQEVTEVEVLRE